MKNKYELINGIIMCAQGVLLDVVALFSIVPVIANLLFGDLYGDEKSIAIFSLIMWIIISIIGSMISMIGKNKISEYCSKDYLNSNNSINTNTVQTQSQVPGAGEWQCPRCGKINQNYTGTCGCGQQKPVK